MTLLAGRATALRYYRLLVIIPGDCWSWHDPGDCWSWHDGAGRFKTPAGGPSSGAGVTVGARPPA